MPPLHQVHIAATLISTAGDQDHAGAIAHRLFRLLKPFQVGYSVLIRIKLCVTSFVSHGRNLMILPMRHLALRPHGLSLPGVPIPYAQQGDD